MANTTIRGPGCTVSTPTGWNGKWNQIDYTLNVPDTDTTGFTDNGWQDFEPAGPVGLNYSLSGFAEYDGSSTAPMSATLMASTVALSAASGSFTLTFQTGCSLGFTGTINNQSGSRGVRDAMTASIGGNSSGAVTLTWDETP